MAPNTTRAMDAVEAFNRYDPGSRYPHPSDVNPASGASRQPLRVDPRYPLSTPQTGSHHPNRTSWAEGNEYSPDGSVGRTASRRRRVSGQGNETHAASLPRNPQLFGPENSPRGSSDRPRDANGNGNRSNFSPTQPSSKSFAARARMAPDFHDIIPAPSVTNGDRTNARRPRRSSIPQPAVAASRLPTQTAPTAQHAEPKSPRMASNLVASRERTRLSQTNPDPHLNISGSPSQPQVTKTASTRSRPGESDDSRPKWATDRSPLQKLEVKLHDISKEGKRARVEEAEQRLKDSTVDLPDRRRSSATQAAVNRVASAGAGDEIAEKERQTRRMANSERHPPIEASKDIRNGRERRIETASQVRDPDVGFTQNRRRTSEPGVQPELASKQPSRAVSMGQDRRGKQTANETAEIAHNATLSSHSAGRSVPQQGDRRGVVGTRSVSDATRTNGRRTQEDRLSTTINDERRCSRNHDSLAFANQDGASGSSKEVSTQQQQLYAHRAEPSNEQRHDHVQKYTNDPVPGHKVQSHVHALKYEVPPQTASGIEARQKIGFSSRVDNITDNLPPQKHRLSRLLHHGHHAEELAVPHGGPPRHLDEWRQGGVARLTLADVISNAEAAKKDTAWWERNGRSAGGRVPESNQAHYDGGLSDSNGKEPFSRPSAIKRSSTAIGGSRGDSGAVRARQYIGYEGTLRSEQRNRSWLHRPESLIDLQAALKLPLPPLSHTVSDFATANIYPEHIRKPYLSKTLTRSMRSIRVRIPAAPTTFTPPLYLKCGPLLRYTGLKRDKVDHSGKRGVTEDRETWRGSVMIVTTDSESSYKPAPTLRLFHQPMELLPPPPNSLDGQEDDHLPAEYIDPIGGLPKMTRTGGVVYVKPAEDLEPETDVSRIEDDDGLYEVTRTANVPTDYGKANELLGRSPLPFARKRRDPKTVGAYREVKGVRLHTERGVTFWRFNLEVELGEAQARIGYRINKGASIGFWVPARGQTMNIMFHSCNGFSLSVNPASFSGPDPLWRDVLNAHQMKPFHVMIGGGDQIYNDAVMKQTTLFQEWLTIKNPHRKHAAPFSPQMQDELEDFYLERYSMWFSQGLFGMANSQIPMVNIWDDHDIIDGFGSYPDYFMATPVFCGLGNVAFKYYMLFQHQSVADESSADEPSWLLGASLGPYINEYSRSVFMSFGKHVAFLGLDCRTERMRDEILSESSYDIVFERCRREIMQGETKHLIVLLGVPVAYPRLVWLENLLTSKVMNPVKALGRTGLLGGFLNQFDGGVEILDDLDDHWTAKNHKSERNWFIQELQELAAEKSIRITILGGDVHLAAVGQFYSNPKLKIPKDKDFRYMPNVISSAIVNTPPPPIMGDILNKRNKTHHLNHETDEDMIPMFTHDVDATPRNNKRLLPRRNWCSIAEYRPGNTPPPTPPSLVGSSQESLPLPDEKNNRPRGKLQRSLSDSKPSALLRRLSGRAPRSPSPDYFSPQTRMAIPLPSPPQHHSTDGYFPPQDPSEITLTNGTSRANAVPLPVRPINAFHRRPTNFSEMAAKKGGAEDDQVGGDHINLEHGLDIKLNCEINQKDPAGVTVPYRLLVPALWYTETRIPLPASEGSFVEGDDEVLQAQERKPSLLRRLTGRQNNKVQESAAVAAKQGEGNWGQDSETESETQSDGYSDDDYEEDRVGKRGMSRFGLGRLGALGRTLSGRKRDYSPEYKPETSNGVIVGGRRTLNPGQPLPPSQSQQVTGLARSATQGTTPQQRYSSAGNVPHPAQYLHIPQRHASAPRSHVQQHQAHHQAHLQQHNASHNQAYTPPQVSASNSTRSPTQRSFPIQAQPAPNVRSTGTLSQPRASASPYSDLDGIYSPEFEAPPRRRINSKFDANGNSKFFGTDEAGPGVRKDSVGGSGGGEQPGGYNGIEAYKEKGKWRKFF